MAALLRRGLRAAALLTGTPRRTAAWRGEPELPYPAMEETEGCGEAGPGLQGRGAHVSPVRPRWRRRELGKERGAPERTLTWSAMEQMRFLRQELPEEWPLERLARGFGVSLDVVRRVLRSRACPPPHRRLRQDRKALNAAPRSAPGPETGREVRAPDGTLLYRVPWGGPGPGEL